MINMRLQILIVLSLFLFALVATTHAKDDQSFECVDIYKQPSLQHPLLKNHTVQITSQKHTRRSSSLCPRGMVPIHKSRNINFNHSLIAGEDAVTWATLDTKVGSNSYYGASAVFSIHNPTPVITGKISRAGILIESPKEFITIGLGWAIHPDLYGDTLTHFTTYWTADEAGSTGCYNTICKGFIQTSSDFYPGVPLAQDRVDLNLYIVRDGPTQNWVLMNDGSIVGYWPKELFPSLSSGASLISFGASTVGGAPMGNGRFPDPNSLSESSYFKEMGFVDANLKTKSIKELEMVVSIPKPDCYKLNYLRDFEIITYGGGSCSSLY